MRAPPLALLAGLLAGPVLSLPSAAWAASPAPARPAAESGADMSRAVAPLTLPEALRLALAGNPQLAAARRELEASEGAVLQSRARPNPELAYSQEDTRRDTRSITVQLNQTLELGGKRSARMAAAAQERGIAQADLDGAVAELRAQVLAGFHAVLAAQDRVRLAEDTLAIAQRAAEAAGKRVAAGKVAPLDETRARVAESGARLELAQARTALRVARQQLAALWGEVVPSFGLAQGPQAAPATPGAAPAPAGSAGVSSLPEPIALDDLAARLESAPRLLRAQRELARRRALADLERARRVPDPTVSLGVIRATEVGRNQLVLGLSLPIPVFDANRGQHLQALRQADKAEEELRAVRGALYSEAFQARETLATLRQELQSLQAELLPAAQSAYDAASRGFELGKFSFLEVLDAQRTLAQARGQQLAAWLEAQRAAAEMDRVLGTAP